MAPLGLPPTNLGPPQTCLDAIWKNATKPCTWVRDPQFWSYAHPRFWARVIPHPTRSAILNLGVQWALNLISSWENEIMRMISIFWKISEYGATAARAHLLTFYAPARLNRYPSITDAGRLTYVCSCLHIISLNFVIVRSSLFVFFWVWLFVCRVCY